MNTEIQRRIRVLERTIDYLTHPLSMEVAYRRDDDPDGTYRYPFGVEFQALASAMADYEIPENPIRIQGDLKSHMDWCKREIDLWPAYKKNWIDT